MKIDSERFVDAYMKWTKFKEELLYSNRYHVNNEILADLKEIAEICSGIVSKGKILYRARNYTDNATFTFYINDGPLTDITRMSEIGKSDYHVKKKVIEEKSRTNFWGYNRDESFVPPHNDMVKTGRANPSYIKYLYVAESEYTAIAEIRPYIKSIASVAEIELVESLNIVDISKTNSEILKSNYPIGHMIMIDFAIPANGDDKHYIPLQFVTEYFKSLGYDGIKFSSSLDSNGYNYTLFNYEKCRVISSKLQRINAIKFEIEEIAPKNSR